MWKNTVILIEHAYPFTPPEPQQKYTLRKKLGKADGELEKTKLLASLKHDCLIKLEGLQEQGGEYWMVYEHVGLSLQKWAQTVTREFIENYEQRLILFSRYLADKSIIVAFRRENMGVSETGDPKYYLDTNFAVDASVDRLALKKKYREEIRQLIQYYIDKKNAVVRPNPKPVQPQKKQNSKMMKILQAIEKGKANLCAETPKDSLALVNPHNNLAQSKQGKGGKNMNLQNIFIQKEMNKINKIQVMVGNRPVEVLQEQFKRQYASSSFYINGVPTIKMEREGEARRLFIPSDKLTRFEQVKYKEYKTMKTSGEVYVQDFISVLEADDAEKLTLPGSPRGTMHAYSPRSALQSPPKATAKMITAPPKPLAIQPQKKQPKKQQTRPQCFQRVSSPRNTKLAPQSRVFLSEKDIKTDKEDPPPKPPIPTDFKSPSTTATTSKTFQLQKKVSEAIANSMQAISKFKQAKGVL